jgi:transketolase
MNRPDKNCVNTLRFLAVDAVELANSGHPGLPLGAAPMAYVLWDRFLKHNPKNPLWINRDRFILSAGHGSALLYALLHVYGYDLSLNELKGFRQWGSKTPGHPEYGLTPGVEATTGPLGQGFGMGIGMAIAESFLERSFNKPRYPIIDHYTYSIVSDGDLMEGISSEAASLAGTLCLKKLIYLYDDNHITIEGSTDIAFTEDVEQRFKAYNWNVLRIQDGNDLFEIDKAIKTAKAALKPSLIMIRTHIGYGSPKVDTADVHGAPLGLNNVIETKKALGWPTKPNFYIPDESLKHFRLKIDEGEDQEDKWIELLRDYKQIYPELAKQLNQIIKGEFSIDWRSCLPLFSTQDGPLATRNASGKVINIINEQFHLKKPSNHIIIGGSADLAPSTKTILLGYGDFGFSKDCPHNIHFGVREHAMGAIANGIALHSNLIPYTATFLVFSDYMRPAIRLAALMQTNVIFVFTHDSIAIGEDGPTHQPIEHLASLRTIPGLTIIRPAEANETAIAWQLAIKRKGPKVLVFTRQKLPILDPKQYPIEEGVPNGAYILSEPKCCSPDIILIGTGSEVHLALASSEKLKEKGIIARVVSMPSWELFEEKDIGYRKHVLPPSIPKLALEAGVTLGWSRYVGEKGNVIGIDHFGKSAPGNIVYSNFGFNIDNVVKCALDLLNS